MDKKQSPVQKRSVLIGGHKSSVSLENEFWTGLKEIAAAEQCTIASLISEIDAKRQQGNLSSTLRLHVLHHYMARPLQLAPAPAAQQ